MKNNPPEAFKEGFNVLMLVDRGINNTSHGSRRWINKVITSNPLEYDDAAFRLIDMQNYIKNPDVRLYASINDRKMNCAIKQFQHNQIELSENNKSLFYKKINDSFVSCLMKPESRNNNLFLLDVDTQDTTEISAFLNKNFGIRCHHHYKTPNGHHYIVEPFNPVMIAGIPDVEIKKDGLMLLNWIE